jgi:hypothetical protein
MSRINDIVAAIKTQLSADTTLSASVSYFCTWDDEIYLVNEKKLFPFINIKSETYRTTSADNLRPYDYERIEAAIQISFAVRESSKSEAMTSIWALHDNIITALKSDLTFGGTCSEIPVRPEAATDAARHQDQNFWIGRGVMMFTARKDYFLR